MSEYAMSLSAVFSLSFPAGVALLEARQCRLNPGVQLGWIDRAIIAARNACRRRLTSLYRIVTAPAHG